MKSFLIAALLGAMSLATTAQTKWDLPTGYAAGSFQTENVQQFANEVLGRIRVEPIRVWCKDLLSRRLRGGRVAEEVP